MPYRVMPWTLTVLFLLAAARSGRAVEFEKMGQAIAQLLGTKQAYRSSVEIDGKEHSVFYSKGKSGKAERLAVIQKRVYDPDCTHTWVIGLDAVKAEVIGIRVLEMSCPHAFPTRAESFLGQFKGRGPASVSTLGKAIHAIAKATGSSELTTDAVSVAIRAATKLRGKI